MKQVNEKVLQDYLFIWMTVAITGAFFHLFLMFHGSFTRISSLHMHQLFLDAGLSLLIWNLRRFAGTSGLYRSLCGLIAINIGLVLTHGFALFKLGYDLSEALGLLANASLLLLGLSALVAYRLGSRENGISIILFDGDCGFCHWCVQLVMKWDTQDRFHFASLHSKIGQDLLEKFALPSDYLESVVLIKNNRALTHSDATLEIFLGFPGFWPLLYLLKLMPLSVRNWAYHILANNRRILPSAAVCAYPSQTQRRKFLNDQ